MALGLPDILKIERAGKKLQTTVGAILNLLTGGTVKSLYEGEANTNAFTDAEKTKLAALDPNHFRGTFTTLAALQAVTGVAGDYGDVDNGAGNDVARYIWDADDSAWVEQSGVVAGETSASIKTKYEANPDTNALTDAAKAKVDNITVTNPVNLDTLAASTHDPFELADDTGFTLSGQTLTNSYASLPVA